MLSLDCKFVKTANEEQPNSMLPTDFCLYQAPVERLSLAEQASCLAMRTYFEMSEIPVKVCYRENAEFISSKGRLTHTPLLRFDNRIVTEFQPIVNTLEDLTGLCSKLPKEEQYLLDNAKTLSLYVEDEFTLAELFMSFKNEANFKQYTRERCYSQFPWLLRLLQRQRKCTEIDCLLKTYEWQGFSQDEVLERFGKICNLLDSKLEDKSERDMRIYPVDGGLCLDACIYGHVATILSVQLPDNSLAEVLRQHGHLLRFRAFIEREYLNESESSCV